MEYNSNRQYGRNRFRNSYSRRRPSRYGRGAGTSISVDKLISKASTDEVESIYVKDHNILELPLTKELKDNIIAKKYEYPTKIQHQAIPEILKGKDILGIASTGSGKTAAFLIPMIDKCLKNGKETFLIVEPTRELALQIQDELRQLTKNMKIYSVLIIGGTSIRKQIDILRRDPQFIIATPGRLKDIHERRCINLDKINNVVLDEVDRMLDMGFIDDIRYITNNLNKERQSLFFSATMNKKSEDIANTLLHNPVKIEVEKQYPGKYVDQDVIRIGRDENKFEVLCKTLKGEELKKVLIFTRTKREADNLSDKLYKLGINADSLHGDKRQAQRSRIINDFKKDALNILIATDVASRGLDVNNITHVINYDMPENYDDYTHRIGRTGRAGKKGYAITFVG